MNASAPFQASSGKSSAKRPPPGESSPLLTPDSADREMSVIEQTIREDEFARWISTQWSKLLIAIAVVAGAWYVYNLYSDSQLRNQELSADVFARVMTLDADLGTARKELLQVTDESKKAAATEKYIKTRSDFVRSLQVLGDARAPYGRVATLVALSKRDAFTDAPANEREIIEQFVLRSSQGSDAVSELEALSRARSALADSAHHQEARAQLIAIARSKSIGRVVAAALLAQSALTPAEEAEAKDAITKVISASPELAELLSEESERLAGRSRG